jgi:hypothetical protein
MRKTVIRIQDFTKEVRGFLPIAYRRKKELFVQNLECIPADRMKIEHNSENQEIVLRFRMNENECFSIGNEEGKGEKVKIDG